MDNKSQQISLVGEVAKMTRELEEKQLEIERLEEADTFAQARIQHLQENLEYLEEKADDADQYKLEAELELEQVKSRLQAITDIGDGYEYRVYK